VTRGGGHDAITCRFLHVPYEELEAEVRRGASDAAALDWAFARGRKPSEEQVLIWNAYMAKRNWRDEHTPRLYYRLQREGLPATAARTMFDFLDLDEGRLPRSAD
jgi:gluconokinase